MVPTARRRVRPHLGDTRAQGFRGRLQPLIRRAGVTDRRRWESALFLKVRDEIQTGNLAIRRRRVASEDGPGRAPRPGAIGQPRRTAPRWLDARSRSIGSSASIVLGVDLPLDV